jgi:hypothetical protein
MSQILVKKQSAIPAKPDSLPRITAFFDAAELIVERSGILLSKCEPVALKLFLLLHLVLDLGVVLWILLWRFG